MAADLTIENGTHLLGSPTYPREDYVLRPANHQCATKVVESFISSGSFVYACGRIS